MDDSDEHLAWQDIVGPTLTYRKLDYWTRKGFIRADNPGPGSGYTRTWSVAEAACAVAMSRLVAAGIPPGAACRAARNDGWLSDTVRVVVVEKPTADYPTHVVYSAQ